MTTDETLRERLIRISEEIFTDDLAPRTVIVVPSLSLDEAELAKIAGAHHYEQRMLCMLMLLRLPRTQLIYLTSEAIDPAIIDYHLSFLSGIPFRHARERLKLFHCHDASNAPLTQKVLDRPRQLERIRRSIEVPDAAHMMCFNATELEAELARRLDVPLYACPPELEHLGTKSSSREIFREAGVALPPGAERIHTAEEVAEELANLRQADAGLRRAVVKLNEGFSGEGNAVFRYEGLDESDEIRHALSSQLVFEAATETWVEFERKLETMGGIVEAFVDGEDKRSPSVQCRIDPAGNPEIISTHDQVLGGPSGQIFLGATFPADEEYRLDLQESGMAVARVLADRGVIGRFGVDYVSVRTPDGWQHFAIEINLRKGGTTHPFIMLEYLTDGTYDVETALFRTRAGEPRYYYATDNLQEDRYRGLLPADLIDIVVENDLHFHSATQTGVSFHLIGALSEYGKLGAVCIERSPAQARELFDATVEALDQAVEAG